MKKEMKNLVKMVKVVVKEVTLSEMEIITCEDAQAVVTKASGVVAGLKWKKAIQRMLHKVERTDKVLSVCPIEDINTGKDMLLMVTMKNMIFCDGSKLLVMPYEEVRSLAARKGIVSDHIELDTHSYLFEFTWKDKKLGNFTQDIILNKRKSARVIRTWKSVSFQ